MNFICIQHVEMIPLTAEAINTEIRPVLIVSILSLSCFASSLISVVIPGGDKDVTLPRLTKQEKSVSEIPPKFWETEDLLHCMCDFLEVEGLVQFSRTSSGNLEIVRKKFSSTTRALPGLTNQENRYAMTTGRSLPFIVIPQTASGHEALYRRFINGKLIYKKGRPGEVVWPFSRLLNPLEGTFDLSQCEEGRYLSIATGYKKAKNPANANKVEIWVAPKFLIEQNPEALGAQRSTVMKNWTNPACPVGLFWTWGGEEVDFGCNYLTTETVDNISANDIYANFEKSVDGGYYDRRRVCEPRACFWDIHISL
jgi:hypothetical protein